jgi:uncharacterized membrane protein
MFRSRRHDSVFGVLGAIGVGAALMYYFDPQAGRRRRALVRGQWEYTLRKLEEGQRVVARDAANRATGLMAQAKGLVRRDKAGRDDVVIVERVRSALGREVSHPHAIEVQASEGTVTLSGAILAHEVENLVSRVGCVRGVKEVVTNLSVHDEPGNIPALQGGDARAGNESELAQTYWSPSTRAAAGGVGAGLALFGFLRGGLGGLALGLLGSGLLARSATNMPVKSIVGVGPNCEGIRIHKAIQVDAPVERVFEYWANFENFPQWMSHVRSVRDEGNNRYHWVVDGPAGVPVEWHSELIDVIENHQMGWRSMPGSMVDHSGRVVFEADPNGGTRVQVELCYVPVAGVVGHAVAKVFGSDPKTEMDDDLARFKSHVETSNAALDPPAHLGSVGGDALPPGTQTH